MPRLSATSRIKRSPLGSASLLCNGSAPTYGVSNANLGISGSSAFTISARCYLTVISGTQTVLSIGSAAGVGTGICIRSIGSSWGVEISGVGVVPVTAPAIKQNKMYEVSVIYGGGSNSVMIAVNGFIINGSSLITLNLTDAPIRWGRDYSGLNPLTGGISDIKVWNTGLTTDQVYALYYYGNVPSSGLIRRFKLNEGFGSSVVDSSTTGDIGTITNPYWSKNNVPFGFNVNLGLNPLDLPSLAFLYEADQGITLDGSNKVQQWNDLSGNGAHMTQATAGLRFGYTASSINGLPSVDLVAGSGNVMSATVPFFVTQPHTLIVLAKSSSAQPAQFCGLVAIGSGGAGGNTSSIGTDNTGKLWFGGAGYGAPTYDTPSVGANYLMIKTSDVSNVTTVINGVKKGTDALLGPFNISPLNLAVIGQYSAGSNSGNWNVALIAGCNCELSPHLISAVTKYLNNKYSLGLTVDNRQAATGRLTV